MRVFRLIQEVKRRNIQPINTQLFVYFFFKNNCDPCYDHQLLMRFYKTDPSTHFVRPYCTDVYVCCFISQRVQPTNDSSFYLHFSAVNWVKLKLPCFVLKYYEMFIT